MKHALAIARRDFEEKRFVIYTSAVFAIVPFLAILLPGLRRNADSWVASVAGIVAIAFAAAIAIGLGSTMIGTDLSAGRLSFYFSKPVSAHALWYGKLVAALSITYASLAIILMPAWLFSSTSWNSVWISRTGLLELLALAVPVLLLLAHISSTMFRTRSAILLADAAALAVAAGTGWLIARPLLEAGAIKLLRVTGGSVATAVVVALVVTGGWHIARGRTDRRANHVELSKFLWSAIAAILLAAGVFIAWVVSVQPADLKEATLYGAPEGPWALAAGPVPHRLDYNTAFLVNAISGERLRLPLHEVGFGAFTFSRNGKVVAWAYGRGGRDRVGEIWTRRLDPPGPVRKTSIATSQWQQVVLSDDGGRLAYAAGNILNVADAANGRSLGSARVPIDSWAFKLSLFFVTPDVVRVNVGQLPLASENGRRDLKIRLTEFDVRDRSIRTTGEVQVRARSLSYGTTPDGSHLIIHTASPENPQDAAFVADARTGARIGTLPADAVVRGAAPLPDGTIVAVPIFDKRARLRRFAADGQPIANADIDLGHATFAYIGGQNASRLLVVIQEHEQGANWLTGWKCVVVDLAHNRVERIVSGVRPARREHAYEEDPRALLPQGALFAALDRQGRIVRFNINTGEVTPLPR